MTSNLKPRRARHPAPTVSLDSFLVDAFKSRARLLRDDPDSMPVARPRAKTAAGAWLAKATQGFISATVRIRRDGIDRKVLVEYAPDPEDSTALLLRLRLASDDELPPSGKTPNDEMMTTQEAADILNVSRPYVVKLIDTQALKGVKITAGGQRRVPRAEVERVHAQMRAVTDRALTEAANVGRGKGRHEKPLTGRWVKD
jgi:excisionase family DNA binding protein